MRPVSCGRSLILLGLLLTPGQAWAQVTGSSYWPFEEAGGTQVLDAGSGNHGTLVGGATRLPTGRVGRALTFDGTSGVATVPDADSLESASFSVALWVRRKDSQGSWSKILTKGSADSAPWGSYKIEFNGSSDTTINWHVGFADGSSAVVQNQTPLAQGQWIHLVGSYAAGTLSLYVNGILEATSQVGPKPVLFDASPLIVGGYTGWGYFKGDVDEVQYFSRALTAGEVQSLVGSPAPAGPQITVTSPNTAVQWIIGSVQTITWTHTLSPTSTSRIEISRNSGSSWTLLAANVPNGGQVGSFQWTVSGSETSQARIRVRATSGSVSDTSNVSFSIRQATMTVTSPNLSSHTWTLGQSATVNWTSNLGPQELVKIELSTNGGSSYPIVLASGTPSDGSEAVAVNGAWATSSARVRITWLRNTSRFDTSNANFTIQSAGLASVTFQPSSAIFPNPERGFYSWSDFTYPDYSHVRLAGNTLTRIYYRLDAYRDVPLPQAFLDQITISFQKARQAGIKVIPRFWYNFGPYPNSEPDASQVQIGAHLQQLAPILAANEDVISSMEAGFIGAWGEWHTSTNGLDTNLAAKAAILSAILAALPPTRMVALRYPSDMQLLNGPPITTAEAFSGSDRARIGSHQDCFLASADDWGTWGRSGNSYTFDKNYVAENARYAVVGGETCFPNPPRSNCPTALAELSMMQWSYLNEEYEPTVIQGFIDGGCMDEIDRRLGYRFRLVSGQHTTTARPGDQFQISLSIANDGFAAMFNARPVFAVLSNGSQQYACQVNADPRWWRPSTTTTVNHSCGLPATMAPGTYSLALWLPDLAPGLRDNPLYAIRFANLGVWDPATGYNIITTNVTITP